MSGGGGTPISTARPPFSARGCTPVAAAGGVRQLRDEVDVLRKTVLKKEERLQEAQILSSRLQGDHWRALRAHQEMAVELQGVAAAETTARGKLAAVQSCARQLSKSTSLQAAAVDAHVDAVHSCFREYADVMDSDKGAGGAGGAGDGATTPTASPGPAPVASPREPDADATTPDAAKGGSANSQQKLRQQIELRDEIVKKLAGHLGALQQALSRGTAEQADLSRKIVMLAGGTME
ncbi:hypothetical protein FOA52_011071 [Chlamydomonas sp. UWO 241]|nr:hypothetical protein FOA52_011071 [Chlamydomonas sp. UWO 241]